MNIRRAKRKDLNRINDLLLQVCMVHHKGRPDLFRFGAKKYTNEELEEILEDEERPVFVAVDENDYVLGYAFCIFQQHKENAVLTDVKTLYIDDLCVDERKRGRHIGKTLYDAVIAFAKEQEDRKSVV